MYTVPVRWYNLSLIYIGWIPGPDFGALGMCSSHWKVVKGVAHLGGGGVCDLVHTQKMNYPKVSTYKLDNLWAGPC